MGNQKNRANHRNRRHPYVKKKNPRKQKSLSSTPTVRTPSASEKALPINVPATIETTLPINAPDGSRIVNLVTNLQAFSTHSLNTFLHAQEY